MNDPEYYDKQWNSNGTENIDGQDQGVERRILFQASTQDWGKSGQSKTISNSDSHNHRQGW